MKIYLIPIFAPLACFVLLLSGCARPVASFTVANTPKAGGEARFDNQSEKATAYRWDFGDGKSSQEAEPTHRYYSSGEYAVRLTATDAKGKTKTTQQKIMVAPPERCLILIETPLGNMVGQLYDATPQHQDNFVKLAEKGYFDSLLFHRVIEGFMIQGGDPQSRSAAPGAMLGSGGPDYTLPAEFVDTLAHVKGAIAAARTNNPEKRSSGSQFYIVQGQPVDAAQLDQIESRGNFRYPTSVRERYYRAGGTPFLDQNYTVFGQIIEGLDVLDQIAAVRTGANDRPQQDVWMKIKLIR